jgi:hypothetical protein
VRAAALCALCACLLAGCTASTAQSAAISPGPATSARIGPVISPPPVTPPTPPGDNLATFACKDTNGGTPGVTVNLTAVRVGQQSGYDRFVLEFDSAVPIYTVKRQVKPVFTQSPSGMQVTLSGTSGVLVQIQKASGANTYSGALDFSQAGYPVLKEAKQLEDFEGSIAWGLGLGSAACIRVFTLKSPSRLVIDFQAPGS